ncbi:RNA-directed DNA polymerase [Sulfuritalea sp.]|uniref:RNA-directed DNA polymerase n=1 Tax=Sulfuritalea sp. TaxID=2480090 RepID=UPI00286E5AA3|nr:RNA-directed DNA polymerase [Sulfuritalea sp.]
MTTPLSIILARGYFPKELPPPFNTKSFGAFADTAPAVLYLDITKKGSKSNLTTLPAIHNQARSGTLRRKLTIPNPVSQYQIARAVAEGWGTLKSACAVSPISLTTPRYLKHGLRAINTRYAFDAMPVARARSRVASRYLLTTDLSQFYPSIYTHSIPWALHTKSVAKARQNDYTLLGNVLDLATRNGQDKQTVGIPIGPDTSLVIAEAILSSVDAKLGGAIAKRGFRYIDDIGCGFRTIAEAEETLGQLQHLIGDLQLQLNPRKTRITELPSELEASWVPHLRLFAFRVLSASTQQTDLLSYFGRAFELAASNREEAILRYSVQRMRSVNIFETNWALYESLLLQCLSVEPGTAPAVIGELYKYHLRMPLDLSRIAESLQQLIEHHAPLHHGSEVVWGLWGAICLDCKLDAKTVEQSLLASDPCVALCALHAISKGLVLGPVDVSGLAALMHEGELVESQWLLAYESNVKGWLPNLGGIDFVAASKHFSPMKAAGVSFYDEAASLPITVKPVVPKDYGNADDDFDLELEHLLGDVSG